MKILHTVSEWKKEFSTIKNKTIGFVPTMGAIHEGHLSLVKRSIEENDITVVSIYLNPTQFNNKSDLEKYPVSIDNDIVLLQKATVDYLFLPEYKTMYPDNYTYKIIETDFSKTLCGASRPGHFDGVLTVVMKLLTIIKPTNAYFGEKDYQQYCLIDGMVKAFFLDTTIVPCPIVREENGLAMSSRNRRLCFSSKEKAALLYKTILSGKDIDDMKRELESSGFEVDYLTTVNNRLYAAVTIDGIRLIDNVQK